MNGSGNARAFPACLTNDRRGSLADSELRRWRLIHREARRMYSPRVLKNEVSIRDVIPGILGSVVTIGVAGDDICLRLLEAYKSREGRRTSILRERGRSR